MRKPSILITGGAGFLGSHLCDRFIKEGFHVIAMDNLITGELKNIQHLFKLEDFEFYHHDVSKYVHVPGELQYILHFASPASPIDYPNLHETEHTRRFARGLPARRFRPGRHLPKHYGGW